MSKQRALVVGGGVGGLSAALSLASQGVQVILLEAQKTIGGKIRAVPVGNSQIDGGPTVFTMRWVFEELFDEAGLSFKDAVSLTKADILARHAWDDGDHLDLHADLEKSADAIGAFFGPAEAKAFLAFASEAKRIYQILEGPFLRSSRPSMLSMPKRLGVNGLAVRPFETMWKALSSHFSDPRLVQLFGRYATYTGASPFLAPATLMLIAHVELDGVWLVKGGMRQLAMALKGACEAKGVTIRTGAKVDSIEVERGKARGVTLGSGERLDADAIILNADAGALGQGLFGSKAARAVKPVKRSDRSLSAIAWTLQAQTSGFPLSHHSVFFGQDYPAEFDAVFHQNQYPQDPTVYICAQDRTDEGIAPKGPERLLMIINAPPNGDMSQPSDTEMNQCMQRALARLNACGLTVSVDPQASVATGPQAFNTLFAGTGGALYGRANHSPTASFARPDNKTKIPGLYLAGGSVHPGPGVPMAALSGRLAAAQVMVDLTSTRRLNKVVTVGGTLMA